MLWVANLDLFAPAFTGFFTQFSIAGIFSNLGNLPKMCPHAGIKIEFLVK
jgi:hypothetical protein